MTTHSPGAITLSTLLHAGLAVLVLAGTWFAQKSVREQPQIFELVAGPGTNYAAQHAASGPNASEILRDTQKLAQGTKQLNNLAKTLQKQEALEAAAEAALQKAALEKPTNTSKTKTTVPQKPSPSKTTTTKPQTKPVSTTTGSVVHNTAPYKPSHIAGETLAESLNNPTGAGGKALFNNNPDSSASYIAQLIKYAREAFQPPDGLSEGLQATVEFTLNPDGSISGATIITSSGNSSYDRAVLAAFRAMHVLSPPPPGAAGLKMVTFNVHDTE